MADNKTIYVNVDSNIKSVTKDTDKFNKSLDTTNNEAREAASSFAIMGVSLNSIKTAIGRIIPLAKSMFATLKAGLISTGIGAFVVVLGTLAQYFKDSEEGASAFKQITSQLGVVVGNVTDIISDLGKSVFKLITGDFAGFKEMLGEVADGVKDFGKKTKKEMADANQLEKDRLALQKFEREAIVSKAETEKEIMKLRLQARDIEKSTSKERLGFMRQANKLAGEQLAKDLEVAKEKLRFQEVENSFSKSTKENLDAEANLKAAVFNIEKANFSERKRMKSEEQAIVREISAQNKKDEKDGLDALKLAQITADLDERGRVEAKLERIKGETNEEYKIRIEAAIKTADEEAKAKIEGEKAVADFKQKTAATNLNSVSATLNIAKQFAGENKALQAGIVAADAAVGIAQTIISTKAANQTIRAQGLSLSAATLGTSVGVAEALIQANNISAGINVAAITAGAGVAMSKLGGGSVGGGSVGGDGAVAPGGTPAPQMMSGAFELSGGRADQPIQAFVLSDDITNSQNGLAQIRRRATI